MKCKFLKKFAAITLAFTMLMPTVASAAPIVNYTLVYDGASHAYSAEEVYISVNGKDVDSGDMPPVVLNNRTLVPARAVFEAMGAEVMWNGTTSEVFISKGRDVVVIQVGNNKGTKNGETFTMDVPPMIINDRTVIPVRAVSEALNCDVQWNGDTRYVIINEDGKSGNTETPETPSTPETPVTPETPQTPTTPTDGEIKTYTNPSGGSVNVNSVSLPASGAAESYTINTSGQISKYTTQLVSGNRLVVDIYDATLAMSNNEISVANSSNITGIRSGQNQVTPQKITRLVFDLKSADSDYGVSFTSDKKGIIVSFAKNDITSINMTSNGKVDTVTVTGKYATSGNVFKLTNPDRVVIDFPNSNSNLPENPSVSGLNVITAIRTGQFDENTTRVTLEVPSSAEVNTYSSGNSFKIDVSKGTLDNISYNSSTRTITMKKIQPININSIAHNDNYINLKYTMTLPGNYSAGNTTITFNEKQITAYTITEDATNVYIKVQNPKEKYDCVVMLDAGHGYQDPGTSGNGFNEKDLNLQVLLKTYALFENDGKDDVKVYATRLDDSYPQNATRAQKANESADMFISIHMNSVSPNAIPNGTELLYKTHSTDVAGKLTSQILAQTLQNSIVGALGTTDRGLKHRTDLLVLNSTKVPAVIVEAVFLSNLGDAQKISNSANQQKVAQAIYDSVYYMKNNYKIR